MTLKKTPHIPVIASMTAMACFFSPFAIAEEPGWYAGGNVGQSRATIDNPRITSGLLGAGLVTTSISDRDRSTGFKIFGGYQFNRNFALEGGYFDLGKFGFTANTAPAGSLNGNIRLNGLNLDAVGTLPITDRLSALGRLGLNSASARDTFAGTGAVGVKNPNPSKRDTNYKVGVGLQYAFSESLSLRSEFERYRINDAVGNKGHIDLLSVGLVYRFGGNTPSPAPQPVAREVMPVAAAPAPAPVAAAPAPVPAPPPPMKVTFSADSLFDFDKATVKPEGKQALDKLAGDLRNMQYDAIKVTGHTDRIGSHAYNLKLSSRRADAVAAYLTSAGGIAPAKIRTEGVDGLNPVTKLADCKGNKRSAKLVACLQPDRRVEVEVTATK